MISSKKQLSAILSSLEKPKIEEIKKELEQYFTPPEIAADIIWRAWLRGEIQDKIVIDPGAGYGILGIGAALMGAKKVYLIEIDENLVKYCKNNIEKLNLNNVEIICDDVFKVDLKADIVIQNPPFGIETEKGMDRKFLEKAMQFAPIIYSLHHFHENAIRVIVRWIEQKGYLAVLDNIYEFKLRPFLDTHKQRVHKYRVALLYCKKLK